jgi:hypothetical protein
MDFILFPRKWQAEGYVTQGLMFYDRVKQTLSKGMIDLF